MAIWLLSTHGYRKWRAQKVISGLGHPGSWLKYELSAIARQENLALLEALHLFLQALIFVPGLLTNPDTVGYTSKQRICWHEISSPPCHAARLLRLCH